MQKSNRILCVALAMSAVTIQKAYANYAILAKIEQLKQCNESAQKTNTSPTDCFFKTIVPQTKSEALAQRDQEILCETKKRKEAYETLEETHYTPIRNRLEDRIKALDSSIRELQLEAKKISDYSDDQYDANAKKNPSNIGFMYWTFHTKLVCKNNISRLNAEIKDETDRSKKTALIQEKNRYKAFIKELGTAYALTAQEETKKLEDLDQLITTTHDADEKSKLKAEKTRHSDSLREFAQYCQLHAALTQLSSVLDLGASFYCKFESLSGTLI